MKKIMCCPISQLPKKLEPEVDYFVLYATAPSEHKRIGHIAPSLTRDVRRFKLAPSIMTWDFTTFALSVSTADKAVLRKHSENGWTRMIELNICLINPSVWQKKHQQLEELLRFLTGDFWVLNFIEGGEIPPEPRDKKKIDADLVCLLSGGIDSLVGAIDLTLHGKKPFFVSHIVRGDKSTQERYAQELNPMVRHCLWSFEPKFSGTKEMSTRGRSIVFFAFAALAASGIVSSKENPVNIFVPENGFISLNIPLSPGRIGSLSTKTTHPVYMDGIQSLWDEIGINAKLLFPYRYKTKGELLEEYAESDILLDLIKMSTSCGKYRIHKYTHCGVCIPCLVRRAAFLKADIKDKTESGYVYENISHSSSKDIAVAAAAFLRYQEKGIRRFIGGALSFSSHDERDKYEQVVARGMDEIGVLLRKQKVI